MSRFEVRSMALSDVEGAAALQALAFPPPFPADMLWQPKHLAAHVSLFPEAQWVAVVDGNIVGSCSNTLISEQNWARHTDWMNTVGGPCLGTFDANGSTLYGLDITVHPSWRRLGIGRAFYERRFALVREMRLVRYGTGCRMPDRGQHPGLNPDEYAQGVASGELTDRTLTPLLRYGLGFLGVINDYMNDEESGNAAALLEWKP